MPKARKFKAPMHKSIVFERCEVEAIEDHANGKPFMQTVRALALMGLGLARSQHEKNRNTGGRR